MPWTVKAPAGKSCRNYRKDGTPFWNELSISTVKNPNDGQVYFIGVQKDVTVQVKAQQRVVQLEAQLADVQAELAAHESDERRKQNSELVVINYNHQ
jgi:hypothetical protein